MCALRQRVSPLPTGLRRAQIFELGFRNASRNPCFFKNGNQGPIQRACGGPTPEIPAKNRDFHWGVRFLLVLRQLGVLGPFSGLLCICEASKKWPRGILLFQNA